MGSSGIEVRCPACGPALIDPFVVELHRDPAARFGFASFLCSGCGEMVASSCPTLLRQLAGGDVPTHRLRCTSPPVTEPRWR